MAKSAGVEDLTGIEWATGLRTLRVDDNAIRNIGPLAGLIELKTLEVDRNEVSDVSALAQLTALEELQLYDNRIEDVGPLEGLHRLRLLYIFANRIEDVAPLAGLEQLHLLRLDQNYLRDISPLAGLRALSSLSLGSNEISDISPLAGMTRMYWLWLNDTRIRDITPLSGLRGVVELNLERNGIEDIGALAGMTDMKVLHLRENRIADVSALAGMRKLEFLRLDSNAVVDVSPLAELTALRELSAQRNGIRDIAALARLTRLEVLALSHNAIKDLSALSGLTGLVELWLEENRVVDLSPLAGLRELEFLDLRFNAVVDVAPLENLTNLDYLDLSHNRIADLKPLAANDGLGKGDRIDVRGNPLTDESVETVLPVLAARGADVASGGVSEFEAVHDDNVVVLRVGDAIAKQTLSTGLALEAYAREFYRHFEDRFDFLMFFSNLDDISDHENAPYYGVYSSVRNDVEGTGRTRYYTNRYGSTERLKGVIHFPYNRALLFGPSLHEVQHAWANYAVPTAVGGHWGFSSANGQLGGFDIADLADLGDGRYAGGPFGTFANGGNGPAYSPIELYLAGFIAPEEVPDPVGGGERGVGLRGRRHRPDGGRRCDLRRGQRENVHHRRHRGCPRTPRPRNGRRPMGLSHGRDPTDGRRPSRDGGAARHAERARGVLQFARERRLRLAAQLLRSHRRSRIDDHGRSLVRAEEHALGTAGTARVVRGCAVAARVDDRRQMRAGLRRGGGPGEFGRRRRPGIRRRTGRRGVFACAVPIRRADHPWPILCRRRREAYGSRRLGCTLPAGSTPRSTGNSSSPTSVNVCRQRRWRHCAAPSPQRRVATTTVSTLDGAASECDFVTMKNITVSVDEVVHRRARIKAAELGTSVSAAVRAFLIRWSGEETDFDRRKRLQDEALRSIEAFRGGDRLPRDDIHDRARIR